MHPERVSWHYSKGNGLFLLEHSPAGDHLGGKLFWTEGWYSSPLLSMEGVPTSPFMFMLSLSTKARLSLNFLLSCPQKSSLPGPCAIVSSKKGTTLAVLRLSISPPAPSAQASASWPPSLGCFPAWFRTQVSPLLYFYVSVVFSMVIRALPFIRVKIASETVRLSNGHELHLVW